MAKIAESIANPLLRRYRPDYRSVPGFVDSVESGLDRASALRPSLTDKESGRVSLASIRGVLSGASGSSVQPYYTFKDGKYDDVLDTSFLRRPDLTVADVEAYQDRLQAIADRSSADLKALVDGALKESESVKTELASGGSSPSEASAPSD